jgi:hypothetical protein
LRMGARFDICKPWEIPTLKVPEGHQLEAPCSGTQYANISWPRESPMHLLRRRRIEEFWPKTPFDWPAFVMKPSVH